MTSYRPTQLDARWTRQYGLPKHMKGQPLTGPVYAVRPQNTVDRVCLSRNYKGQTSYLASSVKMLGLLTVISSFGHVVVSGLYGLAHFGAYFTAGLALYILPKFLRKKPPVQENPAPPAQVVVPRQPAPAVVTNAAPAAKPPADEADDVLPGMGKAPVRPQPPIEPMSPAPIKPPAPPKEPAKPAEDDDLLPGMGGPQPPKEPPKPAEDDDLLPGM